MRISLAGAALAALAPSTLADVLVVDAAGGTPYVDIQAAVDAAQPGDLVLVRSGTYPGFDVIGHHLAVSAHHDAQVSVQGTVSVAATPAGSTVRLTGLDIRGLPSQRGLWIHDNAGLVRVTDCNVEWSQWTTSGVPAPAGVELQSNAGVLLAGCEIEGGAGFGIHVGWILGKPGGPGVLTRSTPLAIYDSHVIGGFGGLADTEPGTGTGGLGGPGLVVEDFGVFLSNTRVDGGSGGHAWKGGNGGTGLVVQGNAQAQLQASPVFGGPGGPGLWGQGLDGSPGAAFGGSGTTQFLPHASRVLEAQSLGSEMGPLKVTVQGLPGDEVWVRVSAKPAHVPALSLGGLWFVGRPNKLPVAPAVVLGASGTAQFQIHLPEVDPAQEERELYLQGWIRTSDGTALLGSPMHVAVLDCAGLVPDCDANGAWDLCDLLSGFDEDCDGNGVLDACEADCNANGVNDVCDLANGTSQDLNTNGVPDECETSGTIYVDASAPAGGNGSQGAPFRTIGEGIAASISGDTVQIAAGTYTGPSNRNLSFGGREIVLQGAGAAVTIVDCALAGRFLTNNDGESAASAVRGLRILRGGTPGGILLDFAHTTIEDCEFVDCKGGLGGGLTLNFSDARVRGCLFSGCIANEGGGLRIQNGAPLIRACTFVGCSANLGAGAALVETSARLIDCHFEGNATLTPGPLCTTCPGLGGAVYVRGSDGVFPTGSLTRCTMIGNEAKEGGGIYAEPAFAASQPAAPLLVDHCLIAGNTADRGAALRSERMGQNLRSSTVVGNVSDLGSPIELEGHAQFLTAVTLRNSILWDDAFGAPLIATTGTNLELQVQRCDVRGGLAAIQIDPSAVFVYGPGNLDSDPLFADPDGPDNLPNTWVDNDLRLGAFSPCADAGDNSHVTPDTFDLDGDLDLLEPTPLDLDDLPRFEDDPLVPDTGAGAPPIVDLGPYERP